MVSDFIGIQGQVEDPDVEPCHCRDGPPENITQGLQADNQRSQD